MDDDKREVVRRPVIFLQAGPPHLFHVTGIYYAWELSKKYDLVLLATTAYRDTIWHSRLLDSKTFIHIEYFSVNNSYSTHSQYVNRIPTLIRNYAPIAALMHSEFYIDNLYLIHYLKLIVPRAVRLYFQSARVGIYFQENTVARHSCQVDQICQKFNLSGRSKIIVSRLVGLRNRLSYLLNVKLFPRALIGQSFNPPVDYITGAILFTNEEEANKKADIDGIHLNYLSVEATANLLHGARKIEIVLHPLKSCSSDVLSFLYGSIRDEEMIFVAPSHGFTSKMLLEGRDTSSIVDEISTVWISALEKLCDRFPGCAIKMKLHPAASKDTVWQKILLLILDRYPWIEIVPPNEPAEKYISAAKVVVGDVSTVLWWASMYRNKTVISLDVFGYAGGEEMRLYSDGITYINDVEQLCEIPERRCGDVKADQIDSIFDILDSYVLK